MSTGLGSRLRYVRRRMPRPRELALRALDELLAPFTRDQLLRHGPEGRRALALTFDDGPSADTTPRLLDLLDEHEAKATFFVVGERIAGCEHVLDRIATSGHELANHTFRHPHTAYLSRAELRQELVDTNTAIGRASPSVRFARPPYGKDRRRFAAIAHDLGLTVAMWSVDSGDTTGYPVPEIVSTVTGAARPGAIVLMHDWGERREQTVEACREILPSLRGAGFDLVTLGSLVGG